MPPSSSSKPPRVRTAEGAARRGRCTPPCSAPAPLATDAAQKRAPATPYTARAPGSAAGRTPVPGAVGRRRMRSLKTQDRLQLAGRKIRRPPDLSRPESKTVYRRRYRCRRCRRRRRPGRVLGLWLVLRGRFFGRAAGESTAGSASSSPSSLPAPVSWTGTSRACFTDSSELDRGMRRLAGGAIVAFSFLVGAT